MRILITGAYGQLGRDLADALAGTVPAGGVRCALLGPEGPRPGLRHDVLGTDIDTMPVDDRDAVQHTFTAFRPELVLHGGAYTAVDLCETEVDAAYSVNAIGTRHVAEAAAAVGAHMVYVSTDYVFDGTGTRPYRESDAPCPTSVYGMSKLAGERECRPGSTIVRTSWLCGAHGKNIVRTVLRLAEGDGDLKFVDDQQGSPTFTADLAPVVVTLGLDRRPGIFHATNSGVTTWCGFARAILAAAGADPERVKPIRTSDRDDPAPCPAYSVLDNMALRLSGLPALPDWQDALARLVPALRGARGADAPMSPNGREARGNRRSVAVIGVGYVGLPTAATLAHFGHRVVLAEREPNRLAALRSGRMPIVEAGLDDLVASATTVGNLRFVESSVDAVAGAEFVFLCVATPMSADGSADLSHVEAAAKEIGSHLEPGTIVVNKSTVPVGSATMVEQVIGRSDISVVSNPEFLREGTAVHDSLNPDRIVVGADDPQAAAKVGELFMSTGAPLIVTDATTSETIKYASNAFLATKLSFVNALAGLCEEVGADARDVLLGLGYDKRIGFEFLRPGPGWGGSCLPKDTRALLHTAQEAGYDFSLLAGAIASNDEQLERVVSKVVAACGGSLGGVAVAVWGLTFKANTDDRRDSPSLDISHRLAGLGARVQAFDPTVDADAAGDGSGPEDLRGLHLRPDPYDAATGATALVVLTEWDEFRWVDFSRVQAVMAEPNIVDARNLLDPAAVRRMGFSYTGIGRQ